MTYKSPRFLNIDEKVLIKVVLCRTVVCCCCIVGIVGFEPHLNKFSLTNIATKMEKSRIIHFVTKNARRTHLVHLFLCISNRSWTTRLGGSNVTAIFHIHIHVPHLF